ncbi:hypothetical protein CBS101457_004139 [Exobasidium rhododendri]|nr:hypothetical protein CBS101457_004139 [Exobasidium rhododendri]
MNSSAASNSGSSPTPGTLQRIAPLALAATIVAGGLAYTTKPLSLETIRRKSYAERMIVAEKVAKKEEESSPSTREQEVEQAKENKDGDDTISSATSDLEEQASQESAFDPETNTINWDCPCLGGMAHGPCGEEFKKAFSCFVFSEEEPKGIDCVENFKGMQDCFRKYPEHYKEELEDEEEYENEEAKQSSDKETQGSGVKDDEDEGVREWRSEMSKE